MNRVFWMFLSFKYERGKEMFESYKLNMFQLQCLKELKHQLERGIEYNEAMIGRALEVNRSTISRCLKKYREQGFIDKDGFTEKGREFLDYYMQIEAELYQYFASVGLEAERQKEAVTGMFDTLDIQTIQKLCQKEKMHLRYENIRENEGEEIRKISFEALGERIKNGEFDIDFTIFRQGKDWQRLSMADRGFEKPARLIWKEKEKYLELKVRKMRAMTKSGAWLSGHIQSVRCRGIQDELKELPVEDKSLKIPMENFEYEQLSSEEIIGQAQMFMTSSIGEKRMPESMATLVIHEK